MSATWSTNVDTAIEFYTKHLGFELRTSAAPAFADVTRGRTGHPRDRQVPRGDLAMGLQQATAPGRRHSCRQLQAPVGLGR
jgi:catechol 2,3-dioxygenase-like lactoylglutathione lyase family enzyme